MRPTWNEKTPWSEWEDCSKEAYEQYLKVPLLHDWAYEVRALCIATPPAPTTEPTAKPIAGLTEEEQRKLIGGFFAEDWAVRKAIDLLHDFTRALAEKNGLAVQGDGT
jgi:hypothetical protein